MAYAHSFSPCFYAAEGDDQYTPETLPDTLREQPCTVHQALLAMPEADWQQMVRDCFPGADPGYVTLDDVMQRIEETDTVSDLCSPVTVWIDPEGFWTVDVHDTDG